MFVSDRDHLVDMDNIFAVHVWTIKPTWTRQGHHEIEIVYNDKRKVELVYNYDELEACHWMMNTIRVKVEANKFPLSITDPLRKPLPPRT